MRIANAPFVGKKSLLHANFLVVISSTMVNFVTAYPLNISPYSYRILGCLLHWLEQDASCPSCRLQLLQNGQGDGINVQSVSNNGATWSTWNWTVGWSRLLQQSITAQSATAAENSQLENLAEQVSCGKILAFFSARQIGRKFNESYWMAYYRYSKCSPITHSRP